jgi:hypothetical protein
MDTPEQNTGRQWKGVLSGTDFGKFPIRTVKANDLNPAIPDSFVFQVIKSAGRQDVDSRKEFNVRVDIDKSSPLWSRFIDDFATAYNTRLDYAGSGESNKERTLAFLMDLYTNQVTSARTGTAYTVTMLNAIMKDIQESMAAKDADPMLKSQQNAAHLAAAKQRAEKGSAGVGSIPGLPTPATKSSSIMAKIPGLPSAQYARNTGGRRKSRKLGNMFNRCVKSVRSTVRARKGSTKESAAIAICTKSVLQTRGRTMKRYRKGRLITQKKFRGGGWGTCS